MFENWHLNWQLRQVRELLDKPKDADLVTAAAKLCEILSYLCEGDRFDEVEEQFHQIRSDKYYLNYYNQDLITLMYDENMFREFLRIEWKILQDAGVSDALWYEMRSDLADAQQALRGDLAPHYEAEAVLELVNSEAFERARASVANVRHRICTLEEEIEEKATALDRHRIILQGLKTAGACGLFLLNATALSSGVATWVGVFSTSLSFYVIDKNAKPLAPGIKAFLDSFRPYAV